MSRALICGVLMAIGCAGCTSEADRGRAEAVLTAYGKAFAAGDGRAGCAVLTARMRRRYRRDSATCAQAFARYRSLDDRELRLSRASITGEKGGALRGIVEFTGDGGMGGEVHLREEGGAWKVDLDLSCVTPDC